MVSGSLRGDDVAERAVELSVKVQRCGDERQVRRVRAVVVGGGE